MKVGTAAGRELPPDIARLPKVYRDYVRHLQEENRGLKRALEAEAPGSRLVLTNHMDADRRVSERLRARWWESEKAHQYMEVHLTEWDGAMALEVNAVSGLVVRPRVSNVVIVQSEWSLQYGRKGGSGG